MGVTGLASIPGFRFDVTGATGTQGALSPQQSWRAYILPRGGYLSADFTGTRLTFDTADVASRFAVDDWIQVDDDINNIRQVTAVGGNSITVSGTLFTGSENERVFLIGTTQPTVTGGSASYIPATTIRQRDDDTSAVFTNSLITSNVNGLIQGFAETNFYDVIIQDGNQAHQGSLIDLSVGVVEGVSVSTDALFGATVTINGALGVTGAVNFDSTVLAGVTSTVNGAFGVTGTAVFGSTVTANAAFGVTGTAVFGSTLTANAIAQFGSSVSIDGALGVTGFISGASDVAMRRLIADRGTTLTASGFSLGANWGNAAVLTVPGRSTDSAGFIQIFASGSGIGSTPSVSHSFTDGFWLDTPVVLTSRGDFSAPDNATWSHLAGATLSVVWRFMGLPVTGTTYEMTYLVVGTSSPPT